MSEPNGLTEVRWHGPSLPPCDFDIEHGDAHYDATMAAASGSWAYMCESCFKKYGPGRLGVGVGQRLVLVKEGS